MFIKWQLKWYYYTTILLYDSDTLHNVIETDDFKRQWKMIH